MREGDLMCAPYYGQRSVIFILRSIYFLWLDWLRKQFAQPTQCVDVRSACEMVEQRRSNQLQLISSRQGWILTIFAFTFLNNILMIVAYITAHTQQVFIIFYTFTYVSLPSSVQWFFSQVQHMCLHQEAPENFISVQITSCQ